MRAKKSGAEVGALEQAVKDTSGTPNTFNNSLTASNWASRAPCLLQFSGAGSSPVRLR
jgi:hypothetical protein